MTYSRRPPKPTKREIAVTLAFLGGVAPPPAPAKRPQGKPEAIVLAEVHSALRRHPLVAWVERINSGVAQLDGRWVRFGWPGASDVLGQLRDGRLLAVECKSATGRTTEAQDEFLARVLAAGGVAFVARSADDVAAALALEAARTTEHPSETPIAPQRPVSQAGRGETREAEGDR